jgi:hypothetical protein
MHSSSGRPMLGYWLHMAQTKVQSKHIPCSSPCYSWFQKCSILICHMFLPSSRCHKPCLCVGLAWSVWITQLSRCASGPVIPFLSINIKIEVYHNKTNSVALVRERIIPTERPPLVGEVSANLCWQRGVVWSARGIPTAVFSISRPERILFLPGSSSVVLTRLRGPHSRSTTSQNIW